MAEDISKSRVSLLCHGIHELVESFLNRPIEGEWPYLRLDAAYLKTRRGGCVVSVATIIVCGMNQDGRREILNVGIGESDVREFWVEFLPIYGFTPP
ncbi:transposase [Castellaniella sp.]|uniref:transposase n=1 Tax=Castellaniella sp. TaxID=1955812 RepID=UPI003561CDC7